MPPKRTSTGGSISSTASKKAKPEPARVSGAFKSAGKPTSTSKKHSPSPAPPAKDVKAEPVNAKDGPALAINNAEYDRHHKEVKKMMGGRSTIHGEANGLNRVDDILRLFDLTYKYGPAAGMTRLDRWNRAEELGMDPPNEVKDILLTREGIGQARYRESYTHATGV